MPCPSHTTHRGTPTVTKKGLGTGDAERRPLAASPSSEAQDHKDWAEPPKATV